jgi:hypothetical protein
MTMNRRKINAVALAMIAVAVILFGVAAFSGSGSAAPQGALAKFATAKFGSLASGPVSTTCANAPSDLSVKYRCEIRPAGMPTMYACGSTLAQLELSLMAETPKAQQLSCMVG